MCSFSFLHELMTLFLWMSYKMSGQPYDSFRNQFIPNAEGVNRTFTMNGMDMNVIHQGLKGAPVNVEFNLVRTAKLRNPAGSYHDLSNSITGRCDRGAPSQKYYNSQNQTMGTGPNRTYYQNVMNHGRSY